MTGPDPGPETPPEGPATRRAQIGRDDYTHADRARDFRAVFSGTPSAAQQQRVLYQILKECRVDDMLHRFDSPNETYYNLGKREVGRFILERLTEYIESPDSLPDKTQNNQGRTAI